MTSEYYPGITIKRLRKERGFSLLDLERSLSINNGFLSLVERGKRKLSLNNLIKVAEFFDVSIDYLVYGRMHKNPQIAELLDILNTREDLRSLLLYCKEINMGYIYEITQIIKKAIRQEELKTESHSAIF